VQVYAAPIRTR